MNLMINSNLTIWNDWLKVTNTNWWYQPMIDGVDYWLLLKLTAMINWNYNKLKWLNVMTTESN